MTKKIAEGLPVGEDCQGRRSQANGDMGLFARVD